MAAQKARQRTAKRSDAQSEQIKDTVTKLTKGVGNLLKTTYEAQENRHPLEGADLVGKDERADSRLRGNDVGVERIMLPITDEVFAANRRSAQYLASRTDM